MFKNISEVKKFIKDKKIEFVDFKLVDMQGRFRHLSIPAERLTESTMIDGIGFDASNYGYAHIEKSDMIFIPDLKTAVLDPFTNTKTLTMMANVYVIDNPKNRPFNQYPRNVVNAAIDYMKKTKIADEMIIGPEYEFNIFDSMQYSLASNDVSYKINAKESELSSNCDNSNGYHTLTKGGYHVDRPCDITFDLRNDIGNLALAQYFCELQYELAPQESDAEEFLKLTLNSLHFLAKNKRNPLQLKSIMELRTLCLAGYMPDLIACTECGKYEDDLMYFCVYDGHLYCSSCTADVPCEEITAGIVSAMRFICYSEKEKLFSFTLNEDNFAVLADVCEKYLLAQTNRKYKTLDFYKSIT